MPPLKGRLLTSPIRGGSVKEVADELGIDPGRISKWRQQHSSPEKTSIGLTDDQKEIRKRQKERKETQLERDILKKAVRIFSRGDGRYMWAL